MRHILFSVEIVISIRKISPYIFVSNFSITQLARLNKLYGHGV